MNCNSTIFSSLSLREQPFLYPEQGKRARGTGEPMRNNTADAFKKLLIFLSSWDLWPSSDFLNLKNIVWDECTVANFEWAVKWQRVYELPFLPNIDGLSFIIIWSSPTVLLLIFFSYSFISCCRWSFHRTVFCVLIGFNPIGWSLGTPEETESFAGD